MFSSDFVVAVAFRSNPPPPIPQAEVALRGGHLAGVLRGAVAPPPSLRLTGSGTRTGEVKKGVYFFSFKSFR